MLPDADEAEGFHEEGRPDAELAESLRVEPVELDRRSRRPVANEEARLTQFPRLLSK